MSFSNRFVAAIVGALCVAALIVAGIIAWPIGAQTSSNLPGAVILLYHRFGEDDIPSTNTTLAEFEAHLAHIKAENYRVVPLDVIVAAFEDGTPLPDKAVAITVDDAYSSFYEEGWPRLKNAGYPVTLFVTTEPVDNQRPGYMSWAEIAEIAEHPLGSIGHHGTTHNSFAFMGEAEIDSELQKASARFEAELGARPAAFAYPYGEANRAALSWVEARGFRAAFGQHSGAAGPGLNRYFLPRFPVTGPYGDIERLRQALNTQPMPVADIDATGLALADGDRPFRLSLTGLAPALDPGRIGCFSGDGQRLTIAALDTPQQTAVTAERKPPLPEGRLRINCTHPAPGGGFYWLGWQAVIGVAGDGSTPAPSE